MLTFLGFEQILSQHRQMAEKKTEEKLESVLDSKKAQSSTEAFFSSLLRTLERKTFNSPIPSRAFEILIKRLDKQFPGVFQFVFFSGEGKVISNFAGSQPPLGLLKRFLMDYSQRILGSEESLKKKWSMYKAFLGPLVKSNFQISCLVQASPGNQKAFVFVSGVHSDGMFISHLNQPPDWDTLGIDLRLRKFNARNSAVRASLLNVEKPFSSSDHVAFRDAKEMRQILNSLETSPRNFFRGVLGLYCMKIISPTHRILGFCPVDSNEPLEKNRKIFVIFLSLIFVILSVLTFTVMSGHWRLFLSIRFKLIFLFCYAAGLPTVVIGVFGGNLLSERRAYLEGQTHLEVEKALRKFDKNFPQAIGQLQKNLRESLRFPKENAERLLPVIFERLKMLFEKLKPEPIVLAREDGEAFPEFVRLNDPDFQAYVRVSKHIYARILRDLNNVPEDPENLKEMTASQITSAAGYDFEHLYFNLSLTLTKVNEYLIGGKKLLQAMFPIYDKEGKARYLVMFGWGRGTIEKRFVKSRLKVFGKSLPKSKLFAANRDFPQDSFPENFPVRRFIQSFLGKLRLKSNSLFARKTSGNTGLLLTGIRGEELSQYDLIAITTDETISAEISRLKRRFFGLGIIMVLISGTVGGILARNFLIPVGTLAEGVDAIRKRQFKFQIPVFDHDELGELATTFNTVIEGLADLEVGRIVQEALFPKKLLEVGNAKVFGNSVPATQVGGDYFDYFPIHQNKLVVVVGDVSGHGVGAALIMAMAKGLIFHISKGEFDPDSILRQINTVFLGTLEGKKMMTCCVAIIDPIQNLFHFGNAGHCFPYLIRKGSIRRLMGGGFPLGKRMPKTYSIASVPLEKGDTLLFYTDGIYEARMISGEPVGFDRMEKQFPNLVGPDPIITVANIRDWHKTIVDPSIPQEDDISFVAVQLE